ncbi:hypothetical protein Ancab_031667 [Ancistrocladus abbreviatus]
MAEALVQAPLRSQTVPQPLVPTQRIEELAVLQSKRLIPMTPSMPPSLVENELPEKKFRLVRCEASAYQKLLMKRVEDNLGALGNSKARAVHNSVIELRNICNHPYISQLHVEEVDQFIPKHFLPPLVRLCGKLEMLDQLLPKLKATNHRVLFFSTMTRLLDVMEEYLVPPLK